MPPWRQNHNSLRTRSNISANKVPYVLDLSHLYKTDTHIQWNTQVRVYIALQTLEELPEPILKQCTVLTKHYQSCLDTILRDYDDENYAIIGGSLEKAARGTTKRPQTKPQHTNTHTYSIPIQENDLVSTWWTLHERYVHTSREIQTISARNFKEKQTKLYIVLTTHVSAYDCWTIRLPERSIPNVTLRSVQSDEVFCIKTSLWTRRSRELHRLWKALQWRICICAQILWFEIAPTTPTIEFPTFQLMCGTWLCWYARLVYSKCWRHVQ